MSKWWWIVGIIIVISTAVFISMQVVNGQTVDNQTGLPEGCDFTANVMPAHCLNESNSIEIYEPNQNCFLETQQERLDKCIADQLNDYVESRLYNETGITLDLDKNYTQEENVLIGLQFINYICKSGKTENYSNATRATEISM